MKILFVFNTLVKSKLFFFQTCALLFAFSILSGCKIHYGFNGASIPIEAKTVSIQYFQNNASFAPSTYSQTFTEALKDKMSSQTRLGLVKTGGDLNFEGSITGYNTSPVALQSSDQAAMNRLTISVNVKYTCSFDEKKNFDQSFTRFADFGGSKSLTEVEDELIKEIDEQLVQDVFNRALNDW